MFTQVYLPAVAGYLPSPMVQCLQHIIEFCYFVRCDVIDEVGLAAIEKVLSVFHTARVVFEQEGVWPDGISLPQQHALLHYSDLI